MATYTEATAALDSIRQLITGAGQKREQAKNALLVARNQLSAIATTYSDEITTLNSYNGSQDEAEAHAYAEKQKLQADFMALKTALETELDALGVSYS